MDGRDRVDMIIIGMVFSLGYGLWRESRKRREAEQAAAQDHRLLRELAEDAVAEAASCAAVVEQLPIASGTHLRLLRERSNTN